MGLGWLFGKKKVTPKVPLPEGALFDEKTFQFSQKFGGENVIEPEHLQEIAGYKQKYPSPEAKNSDFKARFTPEPMPQSAPTGSDNYEATVYVRIDTYQRLLSEIESIKVNTRKMQESCRMMETSEYNEERSFESIRRDMKLIHDRLSQVDKTLFKELGE
jgi:hypothetical protein